MAYEAHSQATKDSWARVPAPQVEGRGVHGRSHDETKLKMVRADGNRANR